LADLTSFLINNLDAIDESSGIFCTESTALKISFIING